MIYVSKRQLREVEYLISQSTQGNHVLFDIDRLRQVFWSDYSTSEEEAYAVEHHIEKIMVQPSLARKKAYLDSLDPPTFHKVVKTYFNIIENNIYESQEIRH